MMKGQPFVEKTLRGCHSPDSPWDAHVDLLGCSGNLKFMQDHSPRGIQGPFDNDGGDFPGTRACCVVNCIFSGPA